MTSYLANQNAPQSLASTLHTCNSGEVAKVAGIDMKTHGTARAALWPTGRLSTAGTIRLNSCSRIDVV